MTRTDTIKTIRGLVEEINSACGSSFNQIAELTKEAVQIAEDASADLITALDSLATDLSED